MYLQPTVEDFPKAKMTLKKQQKKPNLTHLLVSCCNCCLQSTNAGVVVTQPCRRSEPQTFWFLLSVSYLGLLLWLSGDTLFMSLFLRGTVKYFQADIKSQTWNNWTSNRISLLPFFIYISGWKAADERIDCHHFISRHVNWSWIDMNQSLEPFWEGKWMKSEHLKET